MSYTQSVANLKAAQDELDSLFAVAYAQARKEIRGNWLTPSVRARSRDRAIEIVNENMKGTVIKVVKEQS